MITNLIKWIQIALDGALEQYGILRDNGQAFSELLQRNR
jgi:hypothetical protein